MIEFVARRCIVAELEDVGAFVIALYDDRDDPSEWLEIQKSLDAEDQEPDMDGYCICTSDGATHYGGILACVLDRHFLELRLSKNAAQALGFDHLKVRLDVSKSEKNALRDGLNHVFADNPARPERLVLE